MKTQQRGVRWRHRAVFNVGTVNGSQRGGSDQVSVTACQISVTHSFSVLSPKRLILENGDYRSMRSERNLPLNRLNFAKENHQ